MFDIIQALLLVTISVLWWRQNKKINDLEFMMGYVLTVLDDIEEEGNDEDVVGYQ